jgi:hypothetical protein
MRRSDPRCRPARWARPCRPRGSAGCRRWRRGRGACRPHRRGVGIVAADLAISRVAVDHRIHVARRHAPEQIGLAQGLEGLGAGPVGLGDDAHAKALRLQHAADDRHAEAGVIHIGIARDQNDVAAVPAELIHLRTAHGQERRRAEALGPVRLVAGQRLGCAMKKETSTGAFMVRIRGEQAL